MDTSLDKKMEIINEYLTDKVTHSQTCTILEYTLSEYDPDIFLDNVIMERFECRICMSVVFDCMIWISVDENKCGHIFCKECIDSWCKTHSYCPVCKAKKNIIVSSNWHRRELIDSEIQCINDECDWKGKLGNSGKDLCKHEMVKCKHCKTKMLRHKSYTHLKTCGATEITCSYADLGCNYTGKNTVHHEQQFVIQHVKLVSIAINECVKNLRKFGLTRIYEEILNKEKVKCKFSSIGCNHDKKSNDHYNKFSRYHLMLAVEFAYLLSCKIQQIGKSAFIGRNVQALWKTIDDKLYDAIIMDINTAPLTFHLNYLDGDIEKYAPITQIKYSGNININQLVNFIFPSAHKNTHVYILDDDLEEVS
jgi:hypothetical protein